MEAAYRATAGRSTRPRVETLLARASRIADDIEDPYSTAFMHLVRGVCAYLWGDWRGAWDHSMRAETMFRDRCAGVAWELTNASVYALSALPYLGELDRLADMMPQRMIEAEEHGNLYMMNWLRSGAANMLWLAADDPAQAEAQAMLAGDVWTDQGFHVQHYFILWARCQAALYEGDGARAWSLLSDAWPALRRSLLLQVRYVELQALHLRARCAIASAAATPADRPARLRRAKKDARAIRREGMPWTSATADTLDAGIAAVVGDLDAARARLDTAQTGFQEAEMSLYAASCRFLRAALGGEHAEPIDPARAGLSTMTVACPERMTCTLVPGFRDVLGI